MSSHQLTALPYVIKFIPIGFKKQEFDDNDLNLYGFDLDHTLIQPKRPGVIFARGASDWKFMVFDGRESIETLVRLVMDDPNAIVVIFTNQGGVVTIPPNSKSYQNFTGKIKLMLRHIGKMEGGDILLQRLFIYASTKKPASLAKKEASAGKVQNSIGSMLQNDTGNVKDVLSKFDLMRKPKIGMAEMFLKDLKSLKGNAKKWKYYCGDAAGRDKDFSDTDKVFAESLEIEFKTPEDIFHG
ncbi:hypothetical protein RNJ44_03143 [Nakaseomyces bracarensis]|uniref:Uncharacterized protein n=1 Tax=Nakaseomyces bracarensis TaxID=273131 RepID=A0ABR4NYW6_9SACH